GRHRDWVWPECRCSNADWRRSVDGHNRPPCCRVDAGRSQSITDDGRRKSSACFGLRFLSVQQEAVYPLVRGGSRNQGLYDAPNTLSEARQSYKPFYFLLCYRVFSKLGGVEESC